MMKPNWWIREGKWITITLSIVVVLIIIFIIIRIAKKEGFAMETSNGIIS